MDSNKKNKKKYQIKRWLAPVIYFGLSTKAFEFLENLSYFLSSGMSINMALESLEEESGSFRMRRVIHRIKEDVQSGVSLSEAFNNQKFFSESTIEIVRSGELSGKLVDNVKLIIILNDEDKKLKSKINSSLLYGTIIIILTIVVGVGTTWFVLPKIASVYADLGSDLPLLTRLLIKAGNFLVKFGYIFIPSFFVIILIIVYFLFSFPKTKFIGHLILFHIPLVKKLIQQSEVTRFGYLMGRIVEAGLPINRAFMIMPGTTTFQNYKKLYRFLGEKISEGHSLSKSFEAYKNAKKLLPYSVLQMISSAEKSGKLSETFLRIGDLYGLKLENTSRNLPIIIEPVILLLVGIGVAIFVLATMMPIYNLTNIIK